MAYYPLQVEKTLQQYDILAAELGETRIRGSYDAEELELLDEYLAHGRAVRAERTRAEAAAEAPDFIPLVRAWGGVTIAYRKRMTDSPAYRLNHEEVIKSLQEGIAFADCRLSCPVTLSCAHQAALGSASVMSSGSRVSFIMYR